MLSLIVVVILTVIIVGVLVYATDYLTMIPGNFRNLIKFLWIVLGVLVVLYKAGVV